MVTSCLERSGGFIAFIQTYITSHSGNRTTVHGKPARTPLSLSPNQAQCHWQELRETIAVPVWFVAESEKLYLLPVHGSHTQWYRNVLKNPQIRIDARGVKAELTGAPISKSDAVNAVIERFRQKYGAGDVKKYYWKLDVAVLLELK